MRTKFLPQNQEENGMLYSSADEKVMLASRDGM